MDFTHIYRTTQDGISNPIHWASDLADYPRRKRMAFTFYCHQKSSTPKKCEYHQI